MLVNGTFESMTKNWPTMSPLLAERGYCVFAFNYGNLATGPVVDSATELKAFAAKVLRRTGARKVDLVGHSQGGMMPRYYLKFLGGADKVDDLIGLAPSNHGTKGVIAPPPDFMPPADWPDNPACQACADQQAGSPFLRKLNRDGDTVRGPDYTVISTVYDEVVTPYRSQFLDGPRRRVTNIVLQNKCADDLVEHDQVPNDPVAQRLVLNALRLDGPAGERVRPACSPWAG
ncbi:MAG: lipase family alpha/beta hydrolase [Nocardioidaceae bacterium]